MMNELNLLCLILATPALAMVPFFLRRLCSRAGVAAVNLIFLSINREDGKETFPGWRLRVAVSLSFDAVRHLKRSKLSGMLVQTILVAFRKALADPNRETPCDTAEWRAFLASFPIHIVFAPCLNATRWGWVVKGQGEGNNFVLRVLLDLAELTESTRPDLPLPVQYFRFCFALTALHELAHLITKFAFPYFIAPVLSGTVLQFGESGEALEELLLGGKLVCEWDKGHVADFRHLRRLLIQDETGTDFILTDSNIDDWLKRFSNTTATTTLDMKYDRAMVSTVPDDRVRTISRADLLAQARTSTIGSPAGRPLFGLFANAPRIYGESLTTEKTGMLVGRGICYPRAD
ncbi:hypothetical protein B0H14DRAFT_2742321 [Mycena olivaceomarginata]|nr:hypothetical protein B0H14DRAFT_2775720 [Mycena olivaceomarginata]KAJ7861458.1 hypothetical protein B0H14DRAFT_2742321 [Mycena olivaceomarginata]